MDVFLFGGGWRPEARPFTYRRFTEAASAGGHPMIALVIAVELGMDAEAEFARYAAVFGALGGGAPQVAPLFVDEAQPLTRQALGALNPSAVFVCGGLTPLYQAALCQDQGWLEDVRRARLPFGGFSAGAAIAATGALVGGWRLERAGRPVPVTNDDAAEDLDAVSVRRGLGLVPFAVDVHASQWGTLSRLVHAVDAGLIPSGWAVDEDTMLHVRDGAMTVHGLGSAYHVTPSARGVTVSVHVGNTQPAAP